MLPFSRFGSTFVSLTLMEERVSLVIPQNEIENITQDITDDIRDEISIHSDKFVPLVVDENALGFGTWRAPLFCLVFSWKMFALLRYKGFFFLR